MKFGVRECCDVVFRAKSNMKVGNKIFFTHEPVIYFDTLKTSTLEGAATTVYAQGGRGNARLMSWDGERTVTFTMEDALISPEGLSILTGAGLIEGETGKPIHVHVMETKAYDNANSYELDEEVYGNGGFYAMVMDANDNLLCEPFSSLSTVENEKLTVTGGKISLPASATTTLKDKVPARVMFDYYTTKTDGAMQINITPDKFGGAFYVEASTLFREYPSQADLPAEFIIPNARVQSNFTFTMAGSGDPSTFTFTMDAFPDYTKFDPEEKVLASIQVIRGSASGAELKRDKTNTQYEENEDGFIYDPSKN